MQRSRSLSSGNIELLHEAIANADYRTTQSIINVLIKREESIAAILHQKIIWKSICKIYLELELQYHTEKVRLLNLLTEHLCKVKDPYMIINAIGTDGHCYIFLRFAVVTKDHAMFKKLWQLFAECCMVNHLDVLMDDYFYFYIRSVQLNDLIMLQLLLNISRQYSFPEEQLIRWQKYKIFRIAAIMGYTDIMLHILTLARLNNIPREPMWSADYSAAFCNSMRNNVEHVEKVLQEINKDHISLLELMSNTRGYSFFVCIQHDNVSVLSYLANITNQVGYKLEKLIIRNEFEWLHYALQHRKAACFIYLLHMLDRANEEKFIATLTTSARERCYLINGRPALNRRAFSMCERGDLFL